jgi:hypothetical protein
MAIIAIQKNTINLMQDESKEFIKEATKFAVEMLQQEMFHLLFQVHNLKRDLQDREVKLGQCVDKIK